MIYCGISAPTQNKCFALCHILYTHNTLHIDQVCFFYATHSSIASSSVEKIFSDFQFKCVKKSNIEWTMGPGIFRRPIVRSGGRVLARAHDRTYISVSISQRHGNNVNQIENICYINISDRYTHNTYNMRSVCVFVQRMHHRRHSSDYFWVCSTHKQNPTQSKYAWKVLSETKKTFFILLFFMKSSFLSDRIGSD